METIPLIKAFAQKHGLEFEIIERETEAGKFHVWFKGCEIIDGILLGGGCGHGDTLEEAIKNYAHEIRYKKISFERGMPVQRMIIKVNGFI